MKPLLLSAFALFAFALFTSHQATAATVIAGLDPILDNGAPDGWSGVSVLETPITDPGDGTTIGRVTNFSYWDDRGTGTHTVQPLLVQNDGGLYTIIGIGEPHTPLGGPGLQSEPFSLASGTDTLDTSTLGITFHIGVLQFDPGAGEDSNDGTIPFANDGGGGMFQMNVPDSHIPSIDEVINPEHASAAGGRNYAINFEIDFTPLIDGDEDEMPDAWEEEHGLDPNDPDDADDDLDGDTLTNLEEYEAGTDPNEADTDMDTLRDDAELAGAGDRPPTDPTKADTDGDTLSDLVETNTGTFASETDTGTDPTLPDTDGDSLGDGDEVAGNNPDSFTSDPNLVDTDGDSFGDAFEIANGTDPDNAGDFPIAIYIGDVPEQGVNVLEGTVGPDTANSGSVTYAFFSDPYVNATGDEQTLVVTQVNFWASATGTLTPFVGTFNGLDPVLGDSYSVLAVGDPIDGELGLNNAMFEVAGENPVIDLADGAALIAGFHQTGGNPNGMIPWESPGASDPDYLSDFGGAGNNLPAQDAVPAPLGDGANWSTLGREYRFNVAIEPGSGPAPFEITDVSVNLGESSAMITWNSRPGRVYAVDASDDLVIWGELDDGVGSEGAQTSFTESPLPPGAKNRSWRVRDLGRE